MGTKQILARINNQIDYLKEQSRFYKKQLNQFSKINDLLSLKELPFTTKEDITMYNDDFLCAPKHKVRDFITTSGTIGDPVSFYLTHNDRPNLITKREVRIQVLADLELPQTGIIWDVGAGAGTIGLEALRIRPNLKLLCIEKVD